ncbi:MAG: flagellin [Verrucomicrobiae bacterium]|nr:flagellin [Verrucomicrobiae bacterium]
MVINTNTSAISSARLLSESSAMLAKSLSRLSSGSKIVNPEDDAGGLAVSLKFDAQINRNNAAKSNVLNALSFNQTRDGYLQKVQKALDRMSELAVLAQDVTKTESDRALYDKEFQELKSFISETAQKEFNGISLFDGTTLKITGDSDANTFDLQGVNLTDAKYTFASVDISTSTGAVSALTAVKDAIDQLATDRATVAAGNAHLTYVADRLSILNDNLIASNSRIKDVDVAEESTKFARYNILVQAGTAMLAQANASPQSALRLLS